MIPWSILQTLYSANMSPTCSFVQPDFVRWLISDSFVRQSKRALPVQYIYFIMLNVVRVSVLYTVRY